MDKERIEATIDRMLKHKIISEEEHVFLSDALRLDFKVSIIQEGELLYNKEIEYIQINISTTKSRKVNKA